MGIEEKMDNLGIRLPPRQNDFGSVVMASRMGNIVFTCAQAPSEDGKTPYCLGIIGEEVSVEKAIKAARLCALSAIASIRDLIGNLDLVKKVLRVSAFLQVAAGFHDQGQIMNAYSDTLTSIFGMRGKHTRTTVGIPTMIGNQSMEIELWVEVDESH